jgi:transcriptional regulator with XRE-family HTH domain
MPQYDKQRERRTPPHISLGDLRAVSGKTLDQVCEAVAEVTGKPFTRGSLSAIENGHRGASLTILGALEIAYGLRPGALVTDYQPRNREIAA